VTCSYGRGAVSPTSVVNRRQELRTVINVPLGLNGVVRGAEDVHTVLAYARTLYGHQDSVTLVSTERTTSSRTTRPQCAASDLHVLRGRYGFSPEFPTVGGHMECVGRIEALARIPRD
jgi:hypothetical protein